MPTEPLTKTRPNFWAHADQVWAILATSALVLYAILFPRATAVLLLVPIAATLVAISIRSERSSLALPAAPLLWFSLAFAAWALLSSTWSADPMASLSKPLYLIVGAIGIALVSTQTEPVPANTQRQLSRGVILGLILGGAFLCIESITDQAITRLIYNLIPALRAGQEKHLTIDNGVVRAIAENNINRRATIVTLLLIPAALMSARENSLAWRWGGLASLLTIALILMRYSGHQSSQAALVAAVAGFALTKTSSRVALLLIAASWCISCLLIVPIVTTLHGANVHKGDSGLFHSARHRVVIWNYTAEQVKRAPIVGVGADATAAITSAREHDHTAELAQKDGDFTPSAARHAHSVFLQTWYELGGVGAILLTAMGLAALAAIFSAPPSLQPYLAAQFAAIAGMMAFSFGFWQLWFQGAIGLGVLALSLASAGADRRESTAKINPAS